jgi:arylsulfatase A-like enzyme
MPHEHGATAQTRSMRRDIPTLAERMKVLGYTPHMVSANIVTTHIFGLHRGFDNVERVWHLAPGQHRRLHTLLLLLAKPRLRRKLYSLDFILRRISQDLEAAKVWLQSTYEVAFARARAILRTATSRGQRVFCFLNLMETHFPYHIADTFQTSAADFWGKIRELYSLYHFVNQTWMIRDKTYVVPNMLRQFWWRQRQAWERIAASVDAFIREVREQYGALVVFGADHGDNFGEQGWQYHFSNVTDAGTRVPLFWLRHDVDDARTIHLPVSTRDLFGSLLHAAGATEPTAFSLFNTPERSIPIMQSYWYNNRGRTRECFRYNQFAFVAGTQRFVHRANAWYTAPITQHDEPEIPFQPLDPASCPLWESVDIPERLGYVRQAFTQYQAFSARLVHATARNGKPV